MLCTHYDREGVRGVQVFEWAESTDSTLSVELSYAALNKFEFVGDGVNTTLVFPSQVKVLDKDRANGLKADKVIFNGVTSIGMWCFASSNVGTFEFPVLTKIDGYAFHRAYGTHTIIMPELTEIVGSENFLACRDLTTLYVPKLSKITSAGAFAGAPNLKTLDLPGITELSTKSVFGNVYDEDGNVIIYNNIYYRYTYIENLSMPNLTNISAQAFYGNTHLKTLTLENFVTAQKTETVDGIATVTPVSGVFQGMSGIETLNLPALTEITSDKMFKGLTSLKEINLSNVSAINASDTFSGCTNLSKIDLRNLTAIKSNTFYGLTSITSIVADASAAVEDGVLNLASLTAINGDGNFAHCTGLKRVNLPEIETMGNSNFHTCSALESISMPKLKSLGIYSFQSCGKLSDIYLPLLTYLPEGAFKYCGAIPYLGKDPAGGTNDIMPLLTSIGGSCFESASALTSVDLPNLNSTGGTAFNGCTRLATVNLPELTSVGRLSFCNGTSLTELDLPKLTSVGDNAFAGCTSLKEVHFPALTVLNTNMFSGTAIESLYLPSVTQCNITTALANCKYLKTVNMPNIISISAPQMFMDCTSLTEVYMPKIASLTYSTFANCTSLQIVELGAVNTLAEGTFSAPTGHCAVIIHSNGTNVQTTIEGIDALENKVVFIVDNGNTAADETANGKRIELDADWSTDYIEYYRENGVLRYVYVVNGNDIQLLFCFDDTLTTQNMYADLTSIEAESGKTVMKTNNSCYIYTELTGGERIFDSNIYSLYGVLNANGGVTIIGVAWKDYTVTKLVIPDTVTLNGVEYSVTQIDTTAFIAVKDHITVLTLPKDLAEFNSEDPEAGGIVFNKECVLTNLTEYKVADGCENYSVIGGVLYNKDQTILILYPAGITENMFTVPETVTSFYIYAFYRK